ncbi:MAG: c-type cytochrome [Chitinophagaceae bacterium]|nr:c-type cytochrome [Chitinophagaceae bacterium]
MKRKYFECRMKKAFIISLFVLPACILVLVQCSEKSKPGLSAKEEKMLAIPDTSAIPHDTFGNAVRYGRELLINTAYYIGPEGINGRYTGNRMNCTNCHQDAGTKPFSFNLILSHSRYPQYRPREGKVLSLAERVNNCVERPHNGKPIPYDSKEMIAILSYLKWIYDQSGQDTAIRKGDQNLAITFPQRAADPEIGKMIYANRCARCHGENGEGKIAEGQKLYTYPPLWGNEGYQPGSSMHRVIKMARWLKANMPHDSATWKKPVLTDEEALDVAAFVNDDRIHPRPSPETFDYPRPADKAIDYGKGPFVDTFSAAQHKFGPYQPIIDYWKAKGWKPSY